MAVSDAGKSGLDLNPFGRRSAWLTGLGLGFSLGLGGLALPASAKSAASVSAKPLHAPLFKSSAVGDAPDTLEVFCLYVQFQEESAIDDEATTTGLGTFGSAGKGKADPDTKQDYTLDPNGSLRSYQWYLEKHFDFARNYFEKVSNGRVTVIQKFFPTPDSKGKITPYQLPLHMKAYNPSELDKGSKEKISDFADERGQRLMSFVVDAVKLADVTDPTKNPFFIAKKEGEADSTNHKKHRCYLIFHAGHSRLLDGGQLGAFGANTPNDFTDFFVTKDDFKALDSATVTRKKGDKADDKLRAAAKGVPLSTGDTLTEIMMLSEAASQEKVNWGINGILVNQLARKMGMPDMFDVVKGISQLGNFDLMDFAGYNTMNGFLPVYPSAWVRAYMGWEEPVTAKPAASGAYSEYPIWTPTASGNSSHITTVKVPLNDREYLLVENRQRSAGDSTVTIRFNKRADISDLEFKTADSITVPFSKVDSIFLDSLCDDKGKNCKKNPYKPEGIITGASSYDLGLPSSGLLVWHVNEWFISQFLKAGAVNAYLGDTLRSQFKGVELVEADGSPSIGKEFKDQLGQPAFDYGSGSDMLPHISRKRKNPPKDTTWADRPDTLNLIGPYGAANTNAWNDGRTHITLEAPLPANAQLEKSMSSFSGDSIFSVRDSVLSLRVYWPDNKAVRQAAGSAWPAKLDTASLAQSVNVLKNPGGPGSLVVALSDRGYAQALTAAGAPAINAIDTLHPAPGYDSVSTLLPSGKTKDTAPVPVNSLGGVLGKPIGSATLGDTVMAVLTADKLHFLTLRAAGLAAKSKDSSAVTVTLPVTGAAGPLAAGDRFWVVTREHHAVSFSASGVALDDIALPDFDYQSLAVFPGPGGAGQPLNLAAAAAGGKVAIVDASAKTAMALDKPFGDQGPDAEEAFSVTAADFDRDGKVDLFLLGSKGSATMIGLGHAPKPDIFPGFPQRFPRSVHFIDTVYDDKAKANGVNKIVKVNDFSSEDRSGPALADLDHDGHPDILFAGTNSIFAIDYHGAFLKGWPFLLEAHQNVGFTYGSRRHPESAVQSTPLVLSLGGHATVLIGSPDGLIYAVDSAGHKVKSSSFEASQKGRMGILAVDASDWPLTMGGITLDSNDNPDIHLSAADLDGDGELELLAQSGTGSLNVWTLTQGAAAQGLSWTMPGGNAARQNFLDVSGWQAAQSGNNAESIEEFFLFPSPVRGPTATVHLRLGAEAQRARVRVYDLSGLVVKDQSWTGLTSGLQAYTQALDFSHLGADVYSAQVEVWFPGGKQKKWVRFGVIR